MARPRQPSFLSPNTGVPLRRRAAGLTSGKHWHMEYGSLYSPMVARGQLLFNTQVMATERKRILEVGSQS